MKLLYFAWLRTRIGLAQETVSPPPEVRVVADLLDWLAERGPQYAQALAERGVIRAAVNKEYANPDQVLRPDDEVALFPPVTGG